MTADELLAQLSALQIDISVKGDNLLVRGEDKILESPILLKSIRENKSQLIALINAGGSASSPSNVLRIPPNLIPSDCTRITPAMLTLVELTQEEIETIAAGVDGGMANIQDIYPLAPLQEGVLFHHLLQKRADPYVESTAILFDSHERLEHFLQALQAVIDRHDIFRTAVKWEGVAEPVQVVTRHATLVVEHIDVDARAGPVLEQLRTKIDPRTYHIDLGNAPLMRAFIAKDTQNSGWVLLWLRHHLASDHIAVDVTFREIQAHLQGRQLGLPEVLPFRNFIAQTRSGMRRDEHEAYFRGLLGDLTEATCPFGVNDVQGDGSNVEEAERLIESSVVARLRRRAQALGISAASICHLAFAQVLARVSGREDVVFGTVLLGRMHGGPSTGGAPGMYINTLPVRIAVDGSTIELALQNVQQQLANLLRHEHASLALAQRCSAVAPPLPLFTALLNYRHTRTQLSVEMVSAWEGIEVVSNEERTNYPVNLAVNDCGEIFSLSAQTRVREGASRLCDYMYTALTNLVETLEEGGQSTPVCSLEVLPDAERQTILKDWNATDVDYERERCIHELIEDRVRRNPEAIAVVHGEQSLSYGKLNAQANRLARHLRDLGVVPDTRVAICAERGIRMVVCLLAILKSGGAYVPLDPAYPPQRLKYLIGDSSPVLLLWDAVGRASLSQVEVSLPVVDLDADASRWNVRSAHNISNASIGLGSRHLAYIIYTSGSTGDPKGVMVEHCSTVNLLSWAREAFGESELTRMLFSTSVNFDLSVYEMFVPLLVGAIVCIVPNALELEELTAAITQINTVPSAVRALLDQDGLPEEVESLNLAGEVLQRDLVERIFADTQVQRIRNLYGPSETTTYSTCLTMDREQGFVDSIGRPISNTRIYILDRYLRPVPTAAEGEIYIGGAGVARGYLRRPDLTADRFVADPFISKPGARMYRTGDMGRWSTDGSVEFIGRKDQQVKIRGYRIEMGEIESQLSQYPGIRDAVVVAREDLSGEKRLVAYYCTSAPSPRAATLREYLQQRLPAFMVPAAYVNLESLPRNANGKLDRRTLPVPDGDAFLHQAYQGAQDRVEGMLALIWQQLLGVDQVGRNDNFFELGGDSLLAVRALERMRRQGLHSDMRAIFSARTLAELAQEAKWSDVETPPIEKTDRGKPLLLSFAQQRLWFLSQLDGVSTAYHVPIALRLRGSINESALQSAFDQLLQRHESLRTTFYTLEGAVYQRVGEGRSGFALNREDWHYVKYTDLKLKDRMREEFTAPFDLERGPLIRATLITLSRDESALLVVLHHIVSDGLSISIFTRELGSFYNANLKGQVVRLEPLPIQYADYSAWQRRWLSEELLSRQSAYWRRRLEGVPSLLELPTDRPRPDRQDFKGADVPLELDANLTRKLKHLSLRHGLTLFMTVLSAWALVLSKLSNQRDVVIGVPSGNRDRLEVEGLIGFFVNTLAVRLEVPSKLSVRQFLLNVRSVVLEAQSHAELPFERVVELVKPSRSLKHAPIFQVMFAWRGAQEAGLELADVGVSALGGGGESPAKFDLTLSLGEQGGQIIGSLNYAKALFLEETCLRFLTYMQGALASMADNDNQDIATVSLISTSDRLNLLRRWATPEVPYPHGECIHDVFDAQAQRTPEAIAVVHGGRSITFRELERRSNQLANHLRSFGAGPEMVVGMCFERNVDMVIGILGILKSGGAYLPLDPNYPVERLKFMCEDAGVSILVTHSPLREQMAFVEHVVSIGSDAEYVTECRWPVRRSVSRSTNLAYVIYTSGSTGRPKAAMVDHKSVVNLWRGLLPLYHDARSARSIERVALNAAVSFDASVQQLVQMLSGRTLYIVPQSSRIDATALLQFLEEHRIEAIDCTPSQLKLWVSAGLLNCATLSLRHVMVGGEAIDQSLWKDLASCPYIEFHNVYGPTECTVDVTATRVSDADGTTHIGWPLQNRRVYILGADYMPLPLGIVGNIYIGGHGIARGYLRRPDWTAERFLADPFGHPGSRMYQTGDVGRYLAGGNIEYMGRSDFQVKVRGFRIELGEIESKLLEHPGVRDAVVVAREEKGEKRLIAYFRRSKDDFLGVESLRIHLARKVPDYMVPSAYVEVEHWPLTANGKMDRKELPEPGDESYLAEPYQPPQGETEVTLAQIWSDLLAIDRVGRHSNFFDLGGHSLLAVTAVDRMRRAGLRADVVTLMTHPTLSELAAELEAVLARDVIEGIVSVRKTGSLRPLFLIHELGGQGNFFLPLAAQIDTGIPVYGLPAIPLSEPQPTTMAELARPKVAAIRAVQPVGPYRLAGYSFGGMLVYEIAKQLLDDGQPVEFIGNLDQPLSSSSSDEWQAISVSSAQRFFMTYLPESVSQETPGDLRAALAELKSKCDEMEFCEVIGRCQELGCRSVAFQTAGDLERFTARMMAHTRAMLDYSIEPLSAPYYIFATKRDSSTLDPYLGWDAVLPRHQLRLVPVSGTHLSMMESPHVQDLGKAITSAVKCAARELAEPIPVDCKEIIPAMLSLTRLTALEIERIVERVPGGTTNVEDVYPLTPLQEGLLFHYLLSGRGDPYLLRHWMRFDSRARFDLFLLALQAVIQRHSILRTAVQWEYLSAPMQVVWRSANVFVEEVAINGPDCDVRAQLNRHCDAASYRLDICQAPMMRLVIAEEKVSGVCTVLWLLHQLAGDHVTAEVIEREMAAHLAGRADELPLSLRFRDFIGEASRKETQAAQNAYFRRLLSDVEEPTAPFGILDVHGDGTTVTPMRMDLDAVLSRRLHELARALRVSASSIFHFAFARLIGLLSNRDDVVFGTILLGRMQQREGANWVPGPFINTLPVRIRLGDNNVTDGVRAIHAQLTELLRYERAALADAQRCSGVPSPTPLFTALLNYRHSRSDRSIAVIPPPWEGMHSLGSEERSNYPLLLSINDYGEGFALEVQAQAPISGEQICTYMRTTVENLVRTLDRGGRGGVRSVEVLTSQERCRLVVEWNATGTKFPRDKCLHELFEEQVRRSPYAVAVVHGSQALTYQELNRRANQLARSILSMGAGPRCPVAILLPRSIELVCAELAVLKCGAAYIPLDTESPRNWLESVISESKAVVLLSGELTDSPMVDGVLQLNVGDQMFSPQSEADLNVPLNGGMPAYVMYTSGSSGRPHGVVVPHAAVSRLFVNNDRLEFSGSVRVAFSSNPAFDASTLEVWGPLLNGGCIIVVDAASVLAPERFKQDLDKHAVDVLWLTARVFGEYVDVLAPIFAQLRYLIVGGEVVDPCALSRATGAHGPQHVINAYGPTESTTFASIYEVVGDAGRALRIPIGRPIANTRLYILNEHLEVVPVGVIGQIYIGGDGLALGYLSHPGLTAERFIADPHSVEAGTRMYRTGDLARFLPDGNVDYVGRADLQVKLRGFRIEPGEIEARLCEHLAVREAVVSVRESQGDRRLVAHYLTTENKAVGEEVLREHMRAQLPRHMVPVAYLHLERWPLTRNGKLDRTLLPFPMERVCGECLSDAPVGEIEEMLAIIWSELLGVGPIGRNSDFFELGGHSLLAVRVVERMRQEGLHIEVCSLFKVSTLSSLAEIVRARPSAG